MTKEELAAYDYAAMREQDERGKVALAEKRTTQNTKLAIAKEMKNANEPIHKIELYTGLIIAEIAKL